MHPFLQSLQGVLCAAQLALCGQKPETALNSAAAAIQFYVQQTNLVAQLREQQLQAKIVKTQEACKRKLQEVHDAYTAVRAAPCRAALLACRAIAQTQLECCAGEAKVSRHQPGAGPVRSRQAGVAAEVCAEVSAGVVASLASKCSQTCRLFALDSVVCLHLTSSCAWQARKAGDMWQKVCRRL